MYRDTVVRNISRNHEGEHPPIVRGTGELAVLEVRVVRISLLALVVCGVHIGVASRCGDWKA